MPLNNFYLKFNMVGGIGIDQ